MAGGMVPAAPPLYFEMQGGSDLLDFVNNAFIIGWLGNGSLNTRDSFGGSCRATTVGGYAANWCDMRVLIVEDNGRLAELISHGIAQHGFSADGVGSIDEAEVALASVAYDAVILDLGLPDGDGVEWLRRERPGHPLPPILILTARDGMGDRVAGLDAGADDYLVKPVEIEELAARLRALLRRPGTRGLPVIRAG